MQNRVLHVTMTQSQNFHVKTYTLMRMAQGLTLPLLQRLIYALFVNIKNDNGSQGIICRFTRADHRRESTFRCDDYE